MRNFREYPPERLREIAARGGRATPAEKRNFSRSPELAAEAGRLGGQAVAPENRAFSRDRDLAVKAGRAGAAKRNATRIALQAAKTVGSFLVLVLAIAAIWVSFFFIPWDEAMAATAMPDEPRGFMSELARGLLILGVALVCATLLGKLEFSFRRARARRKFDAAVARSSMLLDTEVNGDPSIMGRRP